MFERFTDKARRVVVQANIDARRLGHDHIGTEHLLLGLIHDETTVAALALQHLGIALERLQTEVEAAAGPAPAGPGGAPPPGHIPFTAQARTVLEGSLREALQLGHSYIGTEHLLLALVRDGHGLAAEALARSGAEMDRVLEVVVETTAAVSGKGQHTADAAVDVAGSGRRLRLRATPRYLTVTVADVAPGARPELSVVVPTPDPVATGSHELFDVVRQVVARTAATLGELAAAPPEEEDERR